MRTFEKTNRTLGMFLSDDAVEELLYSYNVDPDEVRWFVENYNLDGASEQYSGEAAGFVAILCLIGVEEEPNKKHDQLSAVRNRLHYVEGEPEGWTEIFNTMKTSGPFSRSVLDNINHLNVFADDDVDREVIFAAAEVAVGLPDNNTLPTFRSKCRKHGASPSEVSNLLQSFGLGSKIITEMESGA
jgi:hypothetical protein